ncbi:MAG TPA: protein kinase [Euzebyales bacterium]|nr:protein kinase [Euzebyales bacterium]
MTDAPPATARLLDDRYVLDGLIGRGGMAEVYRAHDRLLDRAVAVKVMRTVVASDVERARFADEARTLARMSHPGLVTVLDAATTHDAPYLVMELVHGRSLAASCGGVPQAPARVAAIGVQLADALEHAHAAGVVHRDIKPGNVLLSADGRALLADFGVARLLSETTRHTTTGVTVGTPAYLAPEQVGGHDVTPAADVYALGLVLLEALTGARAYLGPPIEAALARLTTPPSIPDSVPASWHGLLRAMTALDPDDRPAAAAVAASLRGLAAGVDPSAATAALPTGPGRQVMTASGPAAPHAGTRLPRPRGGFGRRFAAVGSRPRADVSWLVGTTVAVVLFVLAGAWAGVTERGDGADRPGAGSPPLEAPQPRPAVPGDALDTGTAAEDVRGATGERQADVADAQPGDAPAARDGAGDRGGDAPDEDPPAAPEEDLPATPVTQAEEPAADQGGQREDAGNDSDGNSTGNDNDNSSSGNSAGDNGNANSSGNSSGNGNGGGNGVGLGRAASQRAGS